jgi:hypothetical protein
MGSQAEASLTWISPPAMIVPLSQLFLHQWSNYSIPLARPSAFSSKAPEHGKGLEEEPRQTVDVPANDVPQPHTAGVLVLLTPQVQRIELILYNQLCEPVQIRFINWTRAARGVLPLKWMFAPLMRRAGPTESPR